jgi:signal transduction histidine kinase
LIIPNTEVYKFFMQSDSASVADAAANPTYRFLHDRVQQAAYSLIPDNQKQATHLKIGQLIQENSSEIEQEEKLFDLVGHLNLGQSLINQQQEREALAKLNLKAGRKARSFTAYVATTIYIQTGIELLTDNSWESQYELTLNLYVAATEAAYLNADLDGMEQMAKFVLQNAQTILDKVKIYEIQITSLTAHGHMLEAIAVGRDVLKQLGVELPTEPDEAFIGKGLQALANQLQGRQIEELVDLPVMTDFQTQAAMQLLASLFSPIIGGMPGLLPILAFTMVSLSLQFGNAPASTIGYVAHGMVMCAFLGQVKQGYKFGNLAINLLDRFNVPEIKSQVLAIFGSFVQHHQELLIATVPTLKSGYVAGIETGDFLSAGYNSSSYGYAIYFGGQELSSVESEMIDLSVALGHINQYSAQGYVDITRQMMQNLMETMTQPDALIGVAYDEIVMVPKHHQNNNLGSLAIVYIYKMLLAYVFGNYPAALDHIIQSKKYLIAVSGLVISPIFHFYAALTQLAIFPTDSETKQAEILLAVETHQTTLQQWAENAPINYLHKWYLVEAEKHRVLGKKADAIDYYDRAIQLAKENQFLNEEALANELAAKFYLDWGKEKVAQAYMIDAYYAYSRWGAKAKVQDLETRYPQLLTPILQKPATQLTTSESLSSSIKTLVSVHNTVSTSSSSSSISEMLDMATVLKAAQSLYGAIEMDELLSSLMQVVMENAGADKAVLILNKDGNLEIAAQCLADRSCNLQTFSIENYQDLPVNVIYYVKRTQETAISTVDRTFFASDSYLIRQHPQSFLCTPILNQGKLIGILYLENSVTAGAFTADRIELLKLLCSQAAISLENARLYQKSQQALENLQQAQLQLIQSEKMSALGNLVAGIAHEINNPVGFLKGNLQPAMDGIKDLFGLIDIYQQEYPDQTSAIQDEIEAIDLDFLRADLPNLVGSMAEGIDRICNISVSLRTFSRADSDRPLPFNIHEGIDSTILILKHRLKASESRPQIEVVKDYDNLPTIQCFAGQLNQVFMNFLANAIDALEDSNSGRSYQEIATNPNQIIIQTAVSEDKKSVIIRFKDNGIGMSESVQQQIFEHLFTTKAVGKGTGLGLAIARQIVVEKHQGTIEVNSTVGEGTEFAIVLPVI